jgi:hypothetical protein
MSLSKNLKLLILTSEILLADEHDRHKAAGVVGHRHSEDMSKIE